MPRKSKLEFEQVQEVVLKLLRREEPAAVLAKRHGVTEATLYRWRDRFIEGGKAALANGQAGSTDQSLRIAQLERQLAERERVVAEMTVANRVFKKLSEGLS